MAQFDKRAIKNDAVDGSKILLLNDQALRVKNAANNADIDLFKLNSSNEWTFIAVPKIGGSDVATAANVASAVAAEASARNSADVTLQTNIENEAEARSDADAGLQSAIDIINTTTIPGEISARQSADTALGLRIDGVESDLEAEETARANADTALQGQVTNIVDTLIPDEQTARFNADQALSGRIDTEESARISADAVLQAQINASNTLLAWKPALKLLSSDAELLAAIEGDTLASILPLGDDDAPVLVEADFFVGDLIMQNTGTNPKIFKVYDDAGVKKLTLVGVDQPAAGHTWVVSYDMPDEPSAHEGRAVWHFTGTEMMKLGDFDWAMADGIDIGIEYAKLTGNILATDNVLQALGKLEKKADDVIADEAAHYQEVTQRLDTITTEDVAEHSSNLYFTDARAKTAAVVDSTSGSQTDQAPSVASMKSYVAAQSDNTEVETFVLNAGHISAGYIDLAHEAHKVLEVTPKGFPPQHPLDDYTLSVEGGVTRITFQGDMLTLIAGDKVKVAYAY